MGGRPPEPDPARTGEGRGVGEERRDVVVVGAGAIGLACAWRLSQRGLRVTVLERDRPGCGASGVAAGMITPVTEADFGLDELIRQAYAAWEAYPDFAAELEAVTGLPTGFRRNGALQLALDRDEVGVLRRLHELQRSLGLESEWLRPRECRALEPGVAPVVAAGIHAPFEAQVDPRALVRALVRAVESTGGEVLAGAEVSAPLLEGDRLAGVETSDGRRVAARATVLAAGWCSGTASWLPAGVVPLVRPVKGQILRLRGAEPITEHTLRTERVYVVPRGDGRVVIGATMEEAGDTTVTAGAVLELLREAYRVLPDVAELELVEAGAGLRPATPDNLPLVGRTELDGLVLATGHFRNGITLAPVAAEAVAELLTEELVAC
jgi:glycine oxidase